MLIFHINFYMFLTSLSMLKFSFEHENACKLIFPGRDFLVEGLPTDQSLKLE